MREMLEDRIAIKAPLEQQENVNQHKQSVGSSRQYSRNVCSQKILEENKIPLRAPAVHVRNISDGKPDVPRKFSLPTKQHSLLGIPEEKRRHSSVEKNSILSQYADHKHHVSSSRPHRKSLPAKLASFDIDAAEIYIPEAYLEAAKSPGSLREELKQLGTIDEYYTNHEEATDLFDIIEDFGK